MVSHADNERLCRVGSGAPMGNLFRRFWLRHAVDGDCRKRLSPEAPAHSRRRRRRLPRQGGRHRHYRRIARTIDSITSWISPKSLPNHSFDLQLKNSILFF